MENTYGYIRTSRQRIQGSARAATQQRRLTSSSQDGVPEGQHPP